MRKILNGNIKLIALINKKMESVNIRIKEKTKHLLKTILTTGQDISFYKNTLYSDIGNEEVFKFFYSEILKLIGLFDEYKRCPSKSNYSLLLTQVESFDYSQMWLDGILTKNGIDPLIENDEFVKEQKGKQEALKQLEADWLIQEPIKSEEVIREEEETEQRETEFARNRIKEKTKHLLKTILTTGQDISFYKNTLHSDIGNEELFRFFYSEILKLIGLFDEYKRCPSKSNYSLLLTQVESFDYPQMWLDGILKKNGIVPLSEKDESVEGQKGKKEAPFEQLETDWLIQEPIKSEEIIHEQGEAIPPLQIDNKFCRKCGKAIQANSRFCPKCGATQQVKKCKVCRKDISEDAVFCPYCNSFCVSKK